MFIEEDEEYEISEESKIIALEEAREFEKKEQEEEYRRELYEQRKLALIEEIKNETYEQYIIKLEQKAQKAKLLKNYEGELYQNKGKAIPAYKFMEGSSEEDLANSFKKVYHYFIST